MAEPDEAPDALSEEELQTLYRHRFSPEELHQKRLLWQTLCRSFFQSYVPRDGTVLDLGAGSCEFINAIEARRRIAVDLNPDTARHADGAEVLLTPSDDLSAVESSSVDVVFTSNFFEHLPSKSVLLATLQECRRVLHPGGRIIVLMPNLRCLPGRYWDFFDHHLPLTDRSLVEALELAGFRPERVVPRFLPYSVKHSRLPPLPILISLYLRFPPAWTILGRQMLVVARA